jgi:hypothetical protein
MRIVMVVMHQLPRYCSGQSGRRIAEQRLARRAYWQSSKGEQEGMWASGIDARL